MIKKQGYNSLWDTALGAFLKLRSRHGCVFLKKFKQYKQVRTSEKRVKHLHYSARFSSDDQSARGGKSIRRE